MLKTATPAVTDTGAAMIAQILENDKQNQALDDAAVLNTGITEGTIVKWSSSLSKWVLCDGTVKLESTDMIGVVTYANGTSGQVKTSGVYVDDDLTTLGVYYCQSNGTIGLTETKVFIGTVTSSGRLCLVNGARSEANNEATVYALGSLSGNKDIDCSLASVFTATLSASAVLSIINPTAAHQEITLIITNGGSQPIQWWSGLSWSGKETPVLSGTGIDVIKFLTVDYGVTWLGTVVFTQNYPLIAWAQPVLNDYTMSGVVSVLVGGVDGTHYAWKLFDNGGTGTTVKFKSASSSESKVLWKLNDKVYLTGAVATQTNESSYLNRFPTSIKIQGSNDNINYTDIGYVSGYSRPAANGTVAIPCYPPFACKYLLFTFSGEFNGDTTGIALQELALTGQKVDG